MAVNRKDGYLGDLRHLEKTKAVFVRNKSIKMFLTSNHNNASSSESVLV